jgi:dTDP-4-amino-4,6-dideoxygalactose transaminase
VLKIPFYKPSIGQEEIDEVVATLKSGWLTTGPRTKQFEKEFGAYLRQEHAVAVNSCTAALHLALEAIGIKPGQSIVVPTLTFAATAEVVRYLGAQPLLVDCRQQDFNLDVEDAERRICAALDTGRTVSAIMPVHYGGQIGDIEGVRNLARRFNLKIIEDAAHCCPAFYRPSRESQSQTASSQGPAGNWLPVGSSADISCYSFYANKTITTGEGGMACTRNADYADRMRIMSLHGISRDAWKRFTAEGSWYYEIIAPGFKYNLTDIAAAIGIHQLRKADEMHRKRKEWARLYSELLGKFDELILPQEQPDRVHSWHLYALRLRPNALRIDRAQFIAELQQRGIGTSVHWMPLHLHPYYRETYAYVPEDFPVASSLYPELVTLPLYPDLTEKEVGYVCESIKEIVACNARPAPVRLSVPCL